MTISLEITYERYLKDIAKMFTEADEKHKVKYPL
jgi:hypothetical protein